jgi:hypothetical protein
MNVKIKAGSNLKIEYLFTISLDLTSKFIFIRLMQEIEILFHPFHPNIIAKFLSFLAVIHNCK